MHNGASSRARLWLRKGRKKGIRKKGAKGAKGLRWTLFFPWVLDVDEGMSFFHEKIENGFLSLSMHDDNCSFFFFPAPISFTFFFSSLLEPKLSLIDPHPFIYTSSSFLVHERQEQWERSPASMSDFLKLTKSQAIHSLLACSFVCVMCFSHTRKWERL